MWRRSLATVVIAFLQSGLGFCLLQAVSALVCWQFASIRSLSLFTAPLLASEADWAALFGMPAVAILSGAVAVRSTPRRAPALIAAAIAATVEFSLRFRLAGANPVSSLVWRFSDHREAVLLLLASPVLCCVLAVLLVPAGLVRRLLGGSPAQRPPR